jgi:NADH-quinone oxidoreductase subunit E
METMNNPSLFVPEDKVDEVIINNSGKPGRLLRVLEEVQELNTCKFLPKETLRYIAVRTDTPLSQIYSVATFYSFFNLKPQGKHTVIVCRGTACHTKGSKALLEEVVTILGMSGNQHDFDSSMTTPDNLFTIKTVACFGQCALSPVVSIDGIIYSNVNSTKLASILKQVKSTESDYEPARIRKHKGKRS